jgi:hypothetical protein
MYAASKASRTNILLWHLFLDENTSYFTFEIRVEWNEWLFFFLSAIVLYYFPIIRQFFWKSFAKIVLVIAENEV